MNNFKQVIRFTVKFATIFALFVMPVIIPEQIYAQSDQDKDSNQDKVIAKIDGVDIRQSDFALFESLDQQFEQLQDEQKQLAILLALIDVKSLAKKARTEKIAHDVLLQKKIEYIKERELHNFYFQKKIVEKLNNDEIKMRFEKEIAATKPDQEIRARHILVKTEDEAKAVIAELDKGADFIELAKEKSTGPSGSQGGDLGFFGPGQMVPEFEAAAFELKTGAYTKTAVKTQFGFHVIKLEDKRARALPKFEEVQDQMRQMVLRERYLELVKKERKAIDVEIFDEELKTNYEKTKQQQ